ncbi:MAG TPA: hypothetical protein VGN37_20635 [Actinocatenispora sp.]
MLAVASNPHLTADMVAQLVDHDDPDVQVVLAASRHVDADTRARLYAATEAGAVAGSISARMSLGLTAVNPDWLRAEPLDERLRYLDCPHTVFRRVLATCRDLPAHAWQRLDNDPDLSVRRVAARRPTQRRPGTPGTHLRGLPHIRPMFVDHPNFPRPPYAPSSMSRTRACGTSPCTPPTSHNPSCTISRPRQNPSSAPESPLTPTPVRHCSPASSTTPTQTSSTTPQPTPRSRFP